MCVIMSNIVSINVIDIISSSIIIIIIIDTFGTPPVQLRLLACLNTRKGDYGWKASSSSDLSIRAFRAYPLIELIDKQFSVERFEPRVSQSTVSSPALNLGAWHGGWSLS